MVDTKKFGTGVLLAEQKITDFIPDAYRCDAAVAAIQFALETEDGLQFLRLWNEGEFDSIRREWPEAPEEIYIGADPLHKPSK